MRSDQSSKCFRIGHCHVKLPGIENKRSEKQLYKERKGAKVTILTCIRQEIKIKQRIKQQNMAKSG